jgi:regulatory protein
MKIIKYKKLMNNRYKVTLDNNIDLTLYEDVILKYELLIKKSITEKMLKDIKNDNLYYECYYYSLKSINSRVKSKYDLRKLLTEKEYDNSTINDVINLLEKQGYLNDDRYAYSFINDKMITTNWGPYKIKSELIKHKIEETIIDNNLEVFNREEQLIRIEKIAEKMLKSNKNNGGVVLKNKIKNNIINMGYDIDLVNEVVDKMNIGVDKDIVKKEYDKLYKRYSKKYKDKELEYVIKNKLYQKGLYYEE